MLATHEVTRRLLFRVRATVDGREYRWEVEDEQEALRISGELLSRLDVLADITPVCIMREVS